MSYTITLAIFSISILLQFTAVALAFRLIKTTGWQVAWSIIAIALMMMGIRRSISFYQVLQSNVLPAHFAPELIALTISALMVVGVAMVGPLFRQNRESTTKVIESEERFRTLFESSEVSIWREDFSEIYQKLRRLRETGVENLKEYIKKNPTTPLDLVRQIKVLQINAAGIKLFKANSKQEMIEHIEKIFVDNTIEVFVEELCAIWNEKDFFRSEVELKRLDGETITCILSMPIPKTEKGYSNVPVSMLDITDRKQVESTLIESERSLAEKNWQLEVLLSNISGVAYKCLNDSKRTMTYISKGSAVLTGYDSKAFTENATVFFNDLIHPEDIKALKNKYQQHLEARTPYSHEYRIITKSREIKWVWDQARGVYSESGELLYIEGFITDISVRKNEEKQQRQLDEIQRQVQKMESLGTLSAGIAHDFNNIIHAILGFCRMAEEDGQKDGELLSHCLQEIRAGGERATELVNQIKAFSRVDQSQLVPMNLNPIIEESLSLLRGSIPSNIDIQVDLEDIDIIFGNTTQVHQIIFNLCTNAIYALKNNGGSITVRTEPVSIEKVQLVTSGEIHVGDYIVLCVEDNGPGIKAENLKRIFDPFYTTKGVGEGTGLGLAVVHGIVMSMQGAIDVNSVQDLGTEFKIYFPQSNVAANHIENDTSEKPQNSLRGKILFVDDEKAITKLAKLYLERKGLTVSTFNDPSIALEDFSQHPKDYAMVVTDLSMPKMNGVELSSKIRKINETIPILLASGHINVDIKDEKVISSILSKPLNMDALAKAIEGYI